MLVSCSYCSGHHKRGEVCRLRPKNKSSRKEDNYINRFRNTGVWKRKRLEIKERDKFLCQYCLINGKYTFNKLEVHHIEKISKAWHKRLDNSNLITLCVPCHKMADLGDIKQNILIPLVENKE